MFRVTKVHKDWYEDEYDDGEDLFRLDFLVGDDSFQAQLFLKAPEEGDDYTSARLFIERDNRIPVGPEGREDAVRWDYACECWDLTDEEAASLLDSDEAAAVELMRPKVEIVRNTPNDRTFILRHLCGDQRNLKRDRDAVLAHWAKLDAKGA